MLEGCSGRSPLCEGSWHQCGKRKNPKRDERGRIFFHCCPKVELNEPNMCLCVPSGAGRERPSCLKERGTSPQGRTPENTRACQGRIQTLVQSVEVGPTGDVSFIQAGLC